MLLWTGSIPRYIVRLFYPNFRHSVRKLTSAGNFTEGDNVIVKCPTRPGTPNWLITLEAGKQLATHYGVIQHSDIIGRKPRYGFKLHTNVVLRVSLASMAEYIHLSSRRVTPIYAPVANILVSLLDIHIDPRQCINSSRIYRILEAGTGHGCLTMHLSRAIHAANPPLPSLPYLPVERILERDSTASSFKPRPTVPLHIPPDQHNLYTAFAQYKSARSAILHTMDITAQHADSARHLIRNFRHGLYYGNIDFNLSDPTSWINKHAFALNAAVLDLPSPHHHLSAIAKVLILDAPLAVFVPSVTQIIDCISLISTMKLPLTLERVVEVGFGGTGPIAGREWVVKSTIPKANPRLNLSEGLFKRLYKFFFPNRTPQSFTMAEQPEQANRVWVCHPKIGDIVSNGGFIGLWRKMN